MSLNYQQEGEKMSMQSRQQRPMYHYLYGSVDNQPPPGPPTNLVGSPMAAGDETGSLLNTSVETVDSAVTTHTQTDQDSLVGEGFIATDTEDESERLREGRGDFQQLLMTNGGGGGFNSFLGRGGGVNMKDGRRSWLAYCHMFSPVLYFVSLLMLVAVLSCGIALIVLPKRSTPSTGSQQTATTPAMSNSNFRISFSKINRVDYGDGVDQFIVKNLFHPELLYQGANPTRTFIFPFPTGAFWTNLVLPPTQNQGLSFPVVAYPYAFKWSDTLVQVSYSYSHRKEETKAIHDYFYPDLSFACEETLSGRHVTAFDPLSVALQYETTKKGLWSLFLVQGSPYVNMEYGSVTPVISALSTFEDIGCPPLANYSFVGNKRKRRRLESSGYGVCYTDSSTDTTKTVHGVQFILTTTEGWKWIIFASEPLTLEMDTRTRAKVRATEPYNGAFRAAIIPNRTLDDLSMSSGMQRLINHAGIYPIHGDVTWSFSSGSPSRSGFWSGASFSNSSDNKQRVATVSIKFKTRSFVPATSATAPKPLLMLALPHHAVRLSPSVMLGPKGFDFSYNTIKGPMIPVLGTGWEYDQPLLSPGFDNDIGANNNSMFLHPTVKSALIENLKQDINIALPTKTENIYGFGKQSARLAQLVHIASRMAANETASRNATSSGSSVHSLLKQATSRLSSALEAFFTDGVSDKLVYDSNLGGLVTTDGLLDSGADFGNGRYNDHHFHYGYILYASAIMSKMDPSFLAKYRSKIDAIHYDVAHNQNFDSRRRGEGIFFPAARHMNWFDGHSYASGLFPFGNGKSQESSSEAVNCYYGAYLWSLVRNGAGNSPEKDTSPQTDFARLLLSFEVTGAQTYWHMIPQIPGDKTTTRPKIYSDSFVRTNYMVGNVGMNDAICSTWFGTEPLYVHMINFLPVTTAAGELFLKEYATIEYKNVLSTIGEIDTAWRGFVIANHAISDPLSAWKEAQGVSSAELDSGLSKTQLLYWISSRKGFVLVDERNETIGDQTVNSSPSSPPVGAPSLNDSAGSGSGSCSENAKCVATGLTGQCCPTLSGVSLDCCDRSRF